MPVIITVLASVMSLLGAGVLVKGGSLISKKVFKFGIRKKIKKRLKIKLNDSIKTLNYNLFIDTIYEIKSYDRKYYKNLYLRMKEHYRFNERTVETKKSFMRRFDKDFEEDKEYIANIIREEIEKSMTVLKDEYLANL